MMFKDRGIGHLLSKCSKISAGNWLGEGRGLVTGDSTTLKLDLRITKKRLTKPCPNTCSYFYSTQ